MSTAESNPLHVPRRHSTGFRIRSRVQPFRRQQPMGNAAGVPWPALFSSARPKRIGRDIQHLSQIQQPLRRRKPLAAFPLCHRLTAHFQLLRQLLLKRVPWPAAFAGSSSPAACSAFSSAITIHLQYMFSLPVYRLGTTFYKQPAPQKLVAQYLIRHFLAACWPFKPDAASSMAKRAISHEMLRRRLPAAVYPQIDSAAAIGA